ncbi:MAG: divalent metal cation transporter [Pseudomonadota bacterium]
MSPISSSGRLPRRWRRSAPGEEALRKAPRQAPAQLQRIHVDTYVGMAFSNLIAFFIMLTAAATLHAHGGTQIQTATQAAVALILNWLA